MVESQWLDPDDLTAEQAHAGAAAASQRLDRWLCVAVGTAAVLFVGVSALAGAVVQRQLADRAADGARMQVARTAAAATTALWTYTPDTIDTLPDRVSRYLTGDFEAHYRSFIEKVTGPNKRAAVSDTTDVVGVGVEALDGDDAAAIVFTNTTATSPLTKNIPSVKYVAFRLVMRKQGSKWLVADMATVSFMDLTPKI